jgi:hypothetical protein
MPIFEYRWRDRPVRSLFGTWWLSLRPWRMWRTVRIHHPPVVPALVAFLFLVAVLTAIALSAVAAVGEITSFAHMRARSPFLRARVGWSTAIVYSFRSTTTLRGLVPLATIAVWCLMSWVSLMMFPQSMRRCSLRPAQVLRAWAYSVPPWIPVLLLTLGSVGLAGQFVPSLWPRPYYSIPGVIWMQARVVLANDPLPGLG